MNFREYWHSLTRDSLPEARDAAFAELTRRYGEAHRSYHTLTHVQRMLDVLAEHDIPDRRMVEFAVWFHDAVYDTRRPDNEERSARLAAGWLPRLGVSEKGSARVTALILATKNHHPTSDVSSHWLLDADLAVLGGTAGEYASYAAAIREEYAWVDLHAFRGGRARVLRSFLARPRLFQTPEFFERFEGHARQNLSRELVALGPVP